MPDTPNPGSLARDYCKRLAQEERAEPVTPVLRRRAERIAEELDVPVSACLTSLLGLTLNRHRRRILAAMVFFQNYN